MRLRPVKPGLTFRGLRHSNKTWMIADNVPEIAQCLRLGHILKDKVQQTYSHVASEVEHRVLEHLQRRWDTAVDNTTIEFDTSWRAHTRLDALSSASTPPRAFDRPTDPVRTPRDGSPASRPCQVVFSG